MELVSPALPGELVTTGPRGKPPILYITSLALSPPVSQ